MCKVKGCMSTDYADWTMSRFSAQLSACVSVCSNQISFTVEAVICCPTTTQDWVRSRAIHLYPRQGRTCWGCKWICARWDQSKNKKNERKFIRSGFFATSLAASAFFIHTRLLHCVINRFAWCTKESCSGLIVFFGRQLHHLLFRWVL